MRTQFALFVLYLLCISAGAAHSVPHAGARLHGKVLTRAAGEPVVGARITIHPLNRGSISRLDGSYSIGELPHGIFTVVTTAPGFAADSFDITITGQNDVERVILLRIESIHAKEVTIIGERQPEKNSSSVSVIDEKTLDEHRGGTLGESLRDIPGVTLLTTGASIAKPIVRGLHGDRLVVVNAGVTQEGQQWGAEHAPEIDPFSAAKIEIVRGASAVEYGVGAIGGAINVITHELMTEGAMRGEVTLNAFSNNRQRAASLLLEGSLPFSEHGWGWRLQGSGRMAGNSQTPDYYLSNTGFAEIDGSAAFGYHGSGFGFEGYYSHFGTTLGMFSGAHIGNMSDLKRAIERGRPEGDGTFTYDILAPRQEIAHDLLALKSEYFISAIGTLELQANYQQNDRAEFDAHVRFRPTTPSDPPATALLLKTYSTELKLHHLPVLNIFGVVGAKMSQQTNAVGGVTILIPPYTGTNIGAYIIEHFNSGNWSVEGGARFDAVKRSVTATNKNAPAELSYSNVSGAFGVLYDISHEWQVAANIGTAFRPPGVNELFSDNVHHGSAQFEIGSISLGIEQSTNIDLMLRHTSDRANAELGIYRNRIDGYIFLRPDTVPTLTIRGAYPTFRFTQTDAEIVGFEAAMRYQLFTALRLDATMSILRGWNTTHDEPLYQMPADRITLTAHYDLLHESDGVLSECFAEVSLRAVDKQHNVPAEADYAPAPRGYILVDVSLTSDMNIFGTTLHATLSCDNLFDKEYRDYLSRYRYFASDLGRMAALRITIPFGNFQSKN